MNPVDPNPDPSLPPPRAAGDEEAAPPSEGTVAATPDSPPPHAADRAKFQKRYGYLSWSMAILLGALVPVILTRSTLLSICLYLWAIAFFPLLPWLGLLLRGRFPFAQASLISLGMAAFWALAILWCLTQTRLAYASEPKGLWLDLANLCGFLLLVRFFFLPWLRLARQAHKLEPPPDDS